MSLYLCRARLKRDANVTALAPLLVPQDGDARLAASHHLIWSLFADAAERTRDFLWREERPGHFLALSRRSPNDAQGLFEVECKPFAPALAPGDRLGFTLRANPVIARPAARGERGKRHDVVMDALRDVPRCQRADARPDAIVQAGRAWLARQGAAHGFTPAEDVGVDGYETVRIARERGEKPIRFGVLDLTGVLTVHAPDRFLAALAGGFGRSRAFGCGLMLIRRASPA
jgi:CRISPR system Cascade subunit CasE